MRRISSCFPVQVVKKSVMAVYFNEVYKNIPS